MGGDIVLDGLEWNRSFTLSLKKMQESGLLCDTAIQCTDENETSPKPILAHACVLAASSPKLKTILLEQSVNTETGIKHVDNMGFGDMIWHFLLEFIYKSRVVIPASQRHYLREIEDAAMTLSIKGLIDSVTLAQTRGADDEELDVEDTQDSAQDVPETENANEDVNEDVIEDVIEGAAEDAAENANEENIPEQNESTQQSTAKPLKRLAPKRTSTRQTYLARKKRRKFDCDGDYEPSSYLKQEHMCEICNGVFKSRRPLQQHMNQFHPEHKRHFCRICCAPFNSPIAREDHMRKEHGAKRLECIICFKDFVTKDAWRRHMRLFHANVNPKDDASMSLNATKKLEEKVFDANTIQPTFDVASLEEAEQTEETEDTLYANIEVYQEADEDDTTEVNEDDTTEVKLPANTSEEPEDIADSSAHSEVIENIADEEPEVSSAVVRKRGRPRKYPIEIKTEKGAMFNCTECPKEFMTQNGLNAHKHQCHPDVYRGKHVCVKCNRAFGQPGPLEDHMRKKHGAPWLQCAMCDRTFETRDAIYRHERFKHKVAGRRIQKKLRKYECKECGEKFKQSGHLEDHQRKEHGAPLLVCEVCGMETHSKDTLYRHNRYMHGSTGRDTVAVMSFNNLTEEEKAKNQEAIEWRMQNCKFRCDMCDFVASSRHQLDEHSRKHSSLKQYQCELCKKEFKFKVGLLNHQAKHHPEVGPIAFKCMHCDAVFGRQIYLEDHCRKKHDAPRLQCDYCDKTHVTFDAMYRHKRYDHPDKQKRRIKVLHKCQYCQYTTLSKGALDNHTLKHTNVRAFICETCGMDFKYKGDLVKHNRQNHMPDYVPPVWHCEECGLECRNKSILERHVVSRHQKEFTRSFQCDMCEKQFGSKTNRDDHIRFDHNGETIKCQFCKTQFSDVNLWYEHKQKEHPDSASRVLLSEDLFACGICHKQFRKIPLLRRHERYHVTIRPFKCEKCACTFVAKEDLKAHFKVHTGEKNFSCAYCPFSTLRKPALTAHMRIHDESQHLHCPRCERTYINLNSLRKHLRSAHGMNKEEEDNIMQSIQQQKTIYLKIEQESCTEDSEAVAIAPGTDQMLVQQTLAQPNEQVQVEQVYSIQNLSEVGPEIGALIQDTKTLIKEQNPGITTGQVQELIVSNNQVTVVHPSQLVTQEHEATQQEFMQNQQEFLQDQQVFIQQEQDTAMTEGQLVMTDGQLIMTEGQLEGLDSAVEGAEYGGEGEQEVVYIMADEDGREEQATGQVIKATDENGEQVIYLKVAENQYVQMSDAQSVIQ